MIKSVLSKKAIELAEKDGWVVCDKDLRYYAKPLENSGINHILSVRSLIPLYRSLAKKELFPSLTKPKRTILKGKIIREPVNVTK